jgi:hypothetical protein
MAWAPTCAAGGAAARAVGTAGVARGFAAAMREELDFRVEARNMAAVAATWPDQQRAVGHGASVVMPAMHEQLCTEHVLVIEWLDGVNLRAAGQQIDDRGLDRAQMARAVLRSMVYQITEAVCSTLTRILATSCCSPMTGSPCSISARSATSTPSSGSRCRTCCSPSGLANQFLLALLGAASGIVAALLLVAPGGPKVAQSVSLYQLIGYNLLIVSGVLVLRVLFTIFRSR